MGEDTRAKYFMTWYSLRRKNREARPITVRMDGIRGMMGEITGKI